MKKNIFVFLFVLLTGYDAMAQKQDTFPARSLVEKGAQGDLILGNEHKKGQLSTGPQILPARDSSRKKETHSKKE